MDIHEKPRLSGKDNARKVKAAGRKEVLIQDELTPIKKAVAFSLHDLSKHVNGKSFQRSLTHTTVIGQELLDGT